MEGLIDLAFMIVGAGTRPLVAGLTGRFIPPPLGGWAPLGIGAGLHFFGDRIHPYARAYGTGLLVAAAGELLARYMPKIGGGGGEKAVFVPATPEEYIKQRWGI